MKPMKFRITRDINHLKPGVLLAYQNFTPPEVEMVLFVGNKHIVVLLSDNTFQFY
jgi:hypothetical protein